MSQILKLAHENQQLKRQISQYKQVLGVSPFVDDSLLKGGYRVVKTIEDRDKIDCCHRKLGMKVLVVGNDLSFKEYILKTNNCKENIWEEVDVTVTIEEDEVFLIGDYSELSENLTTQKELNLILKQLILNLQTQIDNIELIDEKVQITEDTNFAQIGQTQKDFNKNVSDYKTNSDLKNQEQDDRLENLEGGLANKLDKGTYTGTAQDLKNEIDNIQVGGDTSNLVPYTGANKDVNIASNYFKTSKGFDFTNDGSNYFKVLNYGHYNILEFLSLDISEDNFGKVLFTINSEEGLYYQKQSVYGNSFFRVLTDKTYSYRKFVTEEGYQITNGTPNQALTANGGVFDLNSKADLVGGKVPASQLPSYVDDVLEFANLSSFPAIGESGKIYIAIDTNLTYRWGGSSYVVMSSSLALGETSSTAYRGDRGKTAYDHSQTTGNPHGTTKADIGLGNVPNVDATNPANITQSADYKFFTDTERTKLNSITGINTGDETSSSIVTKLGYTPESNANKSTNINTDKSSDVKFPSVKAVYDWSTIELNKKVAIGLDTVFNFKNISAMTLTEFRSITPNLETIYFTEEQNTTGWQQIRYNGLGITIPATTETLVSLTNENFIELDSDSTFNLIDVANTKINGIFEKDFIIIKFNAGVVTPVTANQWFKVILKINGVQTAVSPVFYLLELFGTVEQIAYNFSLNVTPEMVTNGATLHLKTSATMTFNNPSISVVRVHKSTNANL